jgi:DNA topoisomerase-1
VVKENRDGEERQFRILTLQNGAILGKTDTEMTGAFKNRLVPTDMGMTVSDFLGEHFSNIMDYSFTANIEERFDHIADGKEDWRKMLSDFYEPFHADVERTLEEAERVTKERILGKDPETGRTILTRLSRRGPVIQMGTPEELGEDEKPRYANFPPGLSMEDVDLAQALKLFELPKQFDDYEGKEVLIGAGRFGPYVKWGDQYISLPRGEDPYGVDRDRAIELIKDKKKADEPLATYKGFPITKGKGRFGPFVKWQKTYANVNKKYDFDNLTGAEALEILEAKLEKEANRYIQQWEKEKISIENGRWGPFIRFGRKNVKLPKVGSEKMNAEQAKELTLEDVKEIIEAELPGSFKEKKAKAKKKK